MVHRVFAANAEGDSLLCATKQAVVQRKRISRESCIDGDTCTDITSFHKFSPGCP